MLKTITQEELIPTLEKAGIKAKEYAQPRSVGNPAEFFLTTIPGGKGILIKKGEKIGLKIATCDKNRQAVLSVREGKRKIIKNVKFTAEVGAYGDMLSRLAKRAFNMEIPGARITVSNIKSTGKEVKHKFGSTKYQHTATVTATITKASTNHFLMGMDETSHFIAILPKQVQSVAEAHKLLKPAEVRGDNFKRQGEFFFVPATKAEIKGINEKKIRNSVPLEANSNHHAQFAMPKKLVAFRLYGESRTRAEGATFVKGLIFDKRAYRHAPVDLGDVWHKVIRNKEVNTTLSPSRRVRRYD